jgi:hypothetical protein
VYCLLCVLIEKLSGVTQYILKLALTLFMSSWKRFKDVFVMRPENKSDMFTKKASSETYNEPYG